MKNINQFDKVDFGSDEFVFAYQELGEFEAANAGNFKKMKVQYRAFLSKIGIECAEQVTLSDLEEAIIVLTQDFLEYRTRRVDEITQRRLAGQHGTP